MKKKILNHTSIMIVLAVLITFLAASVVTYSKFNTYMQNGVREEARYICLGMEEYGDTFLSKRLRAVSSSRVTLIQKDGTVLFDSQTSPEKLENHSNRPEFMEAEKDGKSESIRYSETFAKKTFYYAVRLDNGNVLRVGKTVDSVYSTWISSLAVLGILMVLVLIMEFAFVERQTRELIKPINDLDLEHPLNNVCYEELRPLLVRVDEQNRQIRQQVKELKEAEEIRKEFSANVSHELKTPLMSISGYAELMMNGMVPADHVQEFSGRIYHEAADKNVAETQGVQNTVPVQNIEQPENVSQKSDDQTGSLVTSPLVGTFYAAPSQDLPPYVQVGDKVKKGQVLAIVEAMKLMNEIESDFDGEIAEIYVENGQPVEYGQKLFRIR